jgi:hypothetical protein
MSPSPNIQYREQRRENCKAKPSAAYKYFVRPNHFFVLCYGSRAHHLMLFSKKNILTKGKKPLYAASRVINASCGTFARCWSQSANKTSALLRTVKDQGFKRAYSSRNTEGPGSSGGAFGLPFYRIYFHHFQFVWLTLLLSLQKSL